MDNKPRIRKQQVVEDFLDGCAAADSKQVLLALDQGANPNKAWDEHGNPAWYLWLAHPAHRIESDLRHEVFVAMLEEGLVITHGMLSTFASVVEHRLPECALPVLLSLSPECLEDFVFNPGNSHGNELGWWRAVLAEHQASLLGDHTQPVSTARPTPRL